MPRSDEPRTQTSAFRVRVNGQDVSPDEAACIVSIVVEQELVLADTFSLRIRDVGDRTRLSEEVYSPLLDGDRFPVGADIEIGFGREETPQTVLKGEITSLELDASIGGPVLTVRGYDRSYRLYRATKSRTYLNMTDADMARKIAQDHGLSPQVEATSVVHTHVYQHNQTDWEFLRSRADRIGYECFVDDRRLYFRRPAPPGEAPEQVLGETLQRVRLRVSAPTQVQQVTVRGWDPKEKREVVGTATQPSQAPEIGEQRSGAALAGPLGNGQVTVADPVVATQSEATTMARSIYDEIAGDFIQLEGVCLGDPRLRPGRSVKLTGIGRRFAGKYYLSAVTHKFSPGEGYTTHFMVTGRRPQSLSAMWQRAGAAQRGSTRCPCGHSGYPGVVVGLVTNIKPQPSGHDRPFEGQVKVKFPWLSGENGQEESAWARLVMPMAGNGRGFYFIPEIDDEVLVAFEQGDINRPYVIGSLWNGRDRPPKPVSELVGPDGKVKQRIIKSTSGHTITLDDSTDRPSITIVDKTGKNSISLESQTNKLTIAVEGDMVLDASKGTVTIKGKTVDVQATTDLTLKGASASVEATNALTAKGTTTTVEARGKLDVKGAIGTVEASGVLEVKGSLVKIN